MRRHGSTHLLAKAVNHIKRAGRRARLVQQLREERAGERGKFCGFEHHGAACGEAGGELEGDHARRRVPGHDRADHADRLADRGHQKIRAAAGDTRL